MATESKNGSRFWIPVSVLITCTLLISAQPLKFEPDAEVQELTGAMLGDTPIIEDLDILTNEIGGRVTGTAKNLHSVEWAMNRLKSTGLQVRKEAFQMPALWLEKSSSAEITGGAEFQPRVTAMAFSMPANNLVAALVDGGTGSEEDFKRLGAKAKGAFVVVETEVLLDIAGLFREYSLQPQIEQRAFSAGVRGVIYMSSRPMNLLYRHNASLGFKNNHPLLIMERESAQRVLQLLRKGKTLKARINIEVEQGGPYDSYNVVAEIPGSGKPDEFVVVGAHLDSWGLGTGANDNGCNVAMIMDVARQFARLGIKPLRTIRFVLFNGEEQGLIGSWGYVKTHAAELDGHVMAASFDIGSGRINGFFTGGRPELLKATQEALEPVDGLGPFVHFDVPVVGTDNFDFMMEGIGNLVANQEDANYGPNYHAASDTFDKVDLQQLKLNSAVAAAVTYGFANMAVTWHRQTREDLENLIKTTDLKTQMKSFAVWDDWSAGTRGRQ